MEFLLALQERSENEERIDDALRRQIESYERIAERLREANRQSAGLRGGLEKLGDAAKTVAATVAGVFAAKQTEALARLPKEQWNEAQMRALRNGEQAARQTLERLDLEREQAFARLMQNETARLNRLFAPTLELARQAATLFSTQADAQTREGLRSIQAQISAAEERLRGLEDLRRRAEGDEKARLEREILSQRQALEQMHADRALYEQRRDQALKKAGQIRKAAAVAETIANTAVAVTKALAEGGPVLGPVLAAMVAALGAAQTAAVAVQQFSKGTLAVKGGVPGKDSVPALLAPGEAVIPSRQAREYRPILEAILHGRLPPDEMQRRLFQNVNVSIDERGFRLFVQQSGDETRFLDRRYRTYD
ncbi:MAG: hypothetical protein RMM53_04365 [Bacteroidia bacterium]|nr:hypothetical protein [Bacteroidia bacterium]MDW8333432.1 hypothetical protein [Bacteroidia bacterium]